MYIQQNYISYLFNPKKLSTIAWKTTNRAIVPFSVNQTCGENLSDNSAINHTERVPSMAKQLEFRTPANTIYAWLHFNFLPLTYIPCLPAMFALPLYHIETSQTVAKAKRCIIMNYPPPPPPPFGGRVGGGLSRGWSYHVLCGPLPSSHNYEFCKHLLTSGHGWDQLTYNCYDTEGWVTQLNHNAKALGLDS